MKYARLYFEDVTVGAELPPLVKGPIQQIQLTRYAGASGDFNPIHQDDEFAKAAGMGGVFAHGMLSMGFVAQSLTDWAGAGSVRKLGVRFSGLICSPISPRRVEPWSSNSNRAIRRPPTTIGRSSAIGSRTIARTRSAIISPR